MPGRPRIPITTVLDPLRSTAIRRMIHAAYRPIDPTAHDLDGSSTSRSAGPSAENCKKAIDNRYGNL